MSVFGERTTSALFILHIELERNPSGKLGSLVKAAALQTAIFKDARWQRSLGNMDRSCMEL
jgi:hypothetical protein